MKTITIQDETWQKLTKLKIYLVANNFSEVLERMFKIIQLHKLKEELKEVK